MSDINYINQSNGEFYETKSGLIAYKSKDKDYGRVAVQRMFPLQYEEEYLSVRTENYARSDKNFEIGIIRNLSEYSFSQQEIVRRELNKRYFIPEITKVKSVSEEFANTTWNVSTNAGDCEFTVNDMGSNLLSLSDGRIMLTDVYGNRYMIPDFSKVSDEAKKVLEIWL